jgi:hypothetical protein
MFGSNHVDYGWGVQKLAELVHTVGNVRTRKSTVLQGTYDVTVLRWISKRVPNKAGEFHSRSARCGGRFSAIHVGSAEKISDVFALREVKSMR